MSDKKNGLPSGVEINSHALSSNLHVVDLVHRPAWLHSWEHRRPLWVQEVVAEFFGVFFYCYAGMGSTASMNIGTLTNQPGLGNLLQVGLGYGMGITFAITVCAMTSGGHFNPAVTIAFAVWRDFPWTKVPRFIIAQIMGAFVATLVVYAQYRPYILELDAVLIKGGKAAEIFSAAGTAGILTIYPNPGIPLRWVFLNEFFVDIFLGLVIWGVLDPSNIFVTPSTAAPLVGLAYSTVIWGFVPATVATNTARDFGARLATIAIWGTQAWGGRYALIAAFTSILSTLIAATIYELFLSDTSRVITFGSRELISNMDRHREHKAYRYNLRAEHLRNRGNSISFVGPAGTDKQDVSENEKSSTPV